MKNKTVHTLLIVLLTFNVTFSNSYSGNLEANSSNESSLSGWFLEESNFSADNTAEEDNTLAFNEESPERVLTVVVPPSPSCTAGDFIWDNNIHVNGCTVTADWSVSPCCNWTYTIPGPYPSGMTSGPVNIDIGEAVAWDGYCNRSSTGNQTGESYRVIFKKNGNVVWTSPLTGISSTNDGVATGVESAFWSGPLGGAFLPDGTDEIVLQGGVNSVYPSSVCVSYSGCTSTTEPQNWTVNCGDGEKVDVYGSGNGSCSTTPDMTVAIPASSSVYQTIVEVAYKGNYAGSTITVYDNNNNVYCLDETATTPWGGNVYSGELPGSISSVSHNAVTNGGSCGSNFGLQSMVVYAFRTTSTPSAQSGVYSAANGYNDIETFSIPIQAGASSQPRDITVRLPITELTNDGRYLTVNATANGVTGSTTIYGPDVSLNTCCLNIIELTLNDVPAGATNVAIEVVTVNDALPGNPTLDGQSWIMAGFITIDQECVECAITGTATSSPSEVCLGGSSTLTASGSGGATPYNYAWNNGLGNGATKTVSPTSTTNYRVTITDNVGCTKLAITTVSVNPIPSVNAGVDAGICNGQSLTITANAVSGTAPYVYNWSNGLGAGSSKTVSPTANTTYTVTVTDSKGCVDTDNITITVSPNPDVTSVVMTDALCGDSDGTMEIFFADVAGQTTLQLSINGGATFPYSVNDNTGSLLISNLAAGAYTIIGKYPGTDCADNFGVVNVDNDDGFLAAIACPGVIGTRQITNHLSECYGETTEIVMSIPGIFSNFANIHNWWILKSGGLITEYANGSAEFTMQLENIGRPDLVIDVQVIMSDRTYDIAPMLPNVHPTCSTGDVSDFYYYNTFYGVITGTGVLAGSVITLKDNNKAMQIGTGGTATAPTSYSMGAWIKTQVLVQPTTGTTLNPGNNVDFHMTLTGETYTDDDLTCQGGCEGEDVVLTALAIAADPSTLNYAWSNGATTKSITVTAADAANYSVTVTQDNSSCASIDNITLSADPNPVANAGADQTVCSGGAVTLTASGSGGTPGYTYAWSNGLGSGATKSVSPTANTTYTVTVTDSKGCIHTDDVTITLASTVVNPGSIAGDISVCSGYDPTTITSTAPASGGSGGTIEYKWQKREYTCSTNIYSSWSDIAGASGLTYNPTAITKTTQYRRLAFREICTGGFKITNVVTKEVIDNYTDAGTIGSDESLCGQYDPNMITSISDPSGGCGGTAIYRWEVREYNCALNTYGQWSTIAVATASTYNPTSITVTSQYRRSSKRADDCPWRVSDSVTKEVVENFTDGGDLSGDESMCGGYDPSNIVPLTLATGGCGGTPYYAWQKREQSCDGTSSPWSTISGENDIFYNPGAITITTQYRRIARRTLGCTPGWVFSSIVTKEVIENYTDGGTIAADQSVCDAYNPTAITNVTDASGGCGGTPYYLWQKRDKSCNGTYGSWATISGATGLTYDPTTISITTQYRRLGRRAASCTPAWAYSNSVTKEVVENFDEGGTIAADESMCGGYDPVAITNVADATGGCGGTPDYIWQSRELPCGGSYSAWATISGATGLTYNPGAITMTTQYRRLGRRTAGCDPVWRASSTVTKEVTEQYTDPGTIAGNEMKCGTYSPALITNTASPTGGCGGDPFYVWQKSEYDCNADAYGAFANIANSDNLTFQPSSISVTTKYRRVARRDEGCTPVWVISNEIIKTVVENFTDGGTIAAEEEVCDSYDPAMITSSALPNGDNCFGTVEYRWFSSEKDCDAGTWEANQLISGASSTTYNPGTITGTTRYVRQARKLPCTEWNSSNWLVKTVIINNTVAGTIQSNQDFCIEGDPVMLTGTDPSGGCTDGTDLYQWQMREFIDGAYTAFANISGATAATYDPDIVSVNTQYRRRVRKGDCPYINSNVVTVTIKDSPLSGITGPSTICAKEIVTFSVDPAVAGATYAWTFEDGTPASSTAPSVNVEWATTGIKAIELTVTKDGCSATYDAAINITQEVIAVGGPDLEICRGGNITIDGGGTAGGNYTWTVQAGDPTSIDNGANSDDVSVSPLSTTIYKLTVTQNGCSRSDFVTVKIDVNKNPVADAGNDSSHCIGEDFVIGGSPTGTPPLDDPTTELGYIWSPASFLNDETIANPTANINTVGDHVFEVIVYSFNTGCSDTSSVTVTIEPTAKVGNFIWMDSNYDGIQDAGEMGLNGVTVDLLDPSDNIVATTTTSTIAGQAGSYEFEVCTGQYRIDVDETTVTNKIVTKKDVGGDTADSDIDNNGRTVLFSLLPGDNDQTRDAGFAGVIDLSLVKTVTDNAPNVGDVVTYTITVANAGPNDATTVSVEDIVPNGLSGVTNISNGGSMTAGVINWTGLTITNGGSMTLTYDATVEAPGTGVSYENVAQVTAADQIDTDSTPDNDTGNQSEDDEDPEVIVPQQVDLELVKVASDNTPNVGDVITYTITVENKGPDAATGVAVEDIVPNGLSNVTNISNGGSMTSGVINWTGLSIANGGTVVLTYDATIEKPGAGVSYENVAQVTDSDQDDIDSTPDNDDGDQSEDDEDPEVVVPQQVDLELVKVASDNTPNVGDVITYTITVENKGPDAATGVAVEDIVPNGLSNVTNISNGGSMTSGIINWTGLSIANGGTVVLTYDATVEKPGAGVSYENVAQVTDSDQDDTDSTPDNDDGDQSEDDEDPEVIVPQQVDLELVKVASDNAPNVGDVITYTITVENKGPDAATGVAVEDIVPNGLSNVTNISNGGSMTAGVIDWTGLSIANGVTVVLTYDATIEKPGTGVSYENVAQVTDSDQDDTDSTPDNDDGDQSEDDEDPEVVVPQQVDLELVKVASDNTPNVGDVITYTVTVSNNGPDAATGVAVEDIVPNGLSNVTNISNGGSMTAGVIDWTGLSIANGGSIDLTYDATVEAPGTGISYVNVAQVTDSDQDDTDSTPDNDDGDQSEDDEDPEEIAPQIADLNLVKTVNDMTPSVGDVVTFTIVVTNEGPDAATGVRVRDGLPNGYTNITNISSPGILNGPGTAINWSNQSIASGATATFTFDAEVLAPSTGTDYNNIARIQLSDQFDSDSTPGNVADTDGDGNIGSQDPDDDQDPDDEDDGDDAFVVPSGTITGNVSEDTDNDDVANTPIPGVTITLTNNTTGATQTTVTDANGDYEFIDLDAGEYTITEENETNIDPDFVDVFDGDETPEDVDDAVDALNDDSIEVTLQIGEDDDDNNFVEEQLGTISGNVSEDTDNDDIANTPIPGVTITLTDVDAGTTVTTVTDANGDYEFIDLEPGEYTITEQDEATIDPDFVDVFDGDETPEDADDAVDALNDDSIEVTLTPGEDDDDNNFVEEQLGSISGTVLLDTDNDDLGDAPQAGVTVTLLDDNGNVYDTTVTDANGDYTFDDVEPGDYTVVVTDPTDSQSVSDEDESDDGDVDDMDDTVDNTVPVTVDPGEDDDNNNFVDEELGTISGNVSEDTDNDDIANLPIEDVTITLLDATGAVVQTTMTDANGDYEFTGIEPGDYTIVEEDEALIDPDFVDVFDGDETPEDATDAVDGLDDDIIPVTLVAGEDDADNNFVEEQLGSISGTVLLDTDNDDLGDSPQAGVTVTLLDDNGNVYDTTVTDANGNYTFDDVEPGDYTVVVTDPADSQSVSDEDESDDGDADDMDDTVDNSVPVTVDPGEDDNSNNFVDEELGTISGNVSEDTDNDDIANLPIEDVTITLLDATGAVVQTTMTDANGDYEFTGVEPGDYTIVEEDEALIDPDFVDVFDGDETPEDATDAVDGLDDDIIPVTLVAGEDDADNNFVEEQLGSISGTVLLDTDNDDLGDSPQAGVTVTLLDDNGNVYDTTVTDANGNYTFDDVEPGDYTVVVTDPTDSQSVSDEDESDDGDTDDMDDTVDNSVPVTVDPGEDDDSNNFVDEELGTISGNVSVDNGADPNTPLDMIVITLIDENGAVVGITITDVNGDYEFTGVEPGDYTVVESDPTGYFDVSDIDETVDANDPDGNDGATPNDEIPVTVAAGEDDDDNNFVEELINAIVDVEKSTNGEDSDFSPGTFIPYFSGTEEPVNWEYVVTNNGNVDLINVTVFDDVEGQVCVIPRLDVGQSTTCNLSGIAIMGQYTNLATVTAQPIDPNTEDPIGDEVEDEDPSNYFGLAYNIEKTANKDTICPGEEVTYEVAIRMLNGLPGLQFRNISFEDNLLANMIDVNSPEYVEGDDNNNMFLDFGEEEFLWSYALTLEETTTNIVMDMFDLYFEGNFVQEIMAMDSVTVYTDDTKCASIGDLVFYDANGNGINDGEDGVDNVTVNLLNGDGTPTGLTTTTDVNGEYEFTGLVPGDYIVEFVPATGLEFSPQDVTTPGADDTNDSDADVNDGQSQVITLNTGDNITTVDAGVLELLSLGDVVWSDANNDGIKDAGEAGIAFVNLALWLDTDNDNFPDMNTGMTTVTDGNGNYLFQNLVPGDYVVQIIPSDLIAGGVLEDYVSSTDTVLPTDPDDNVNDDDDGYDPGFAIGVISNTIELRSSQEPTNDGDGDANTNLTVDFGFFNDATIGNFVWDDADADGVQDANDLGINGVTVNLYDAANPGTIIGTTVTTNNPDNPTLLGYYLFEGLIPGDYYVEFITPTGTFVTTENNGLTDANDSDLDGTNGPGTTATVTLTEGEDNQTVDAGFYTGAKVGNYVWVDDMTDINGENVQDGSDTGLDGITVNLYETSDLNTPFMTMLTSVGPLGNSGYYLFEDLPTGDYVIEVERPTNLSFVVPNVGGDTADSDIVDLFLGRTLEFTLSPGDCNEDIDAGFRNLPLPVEWLYIRGEWLQDRDLNQISWATASEINNNYFVVERSYEDEGFEDIGTVDSEGNTLSVNKYSFDDRDIDRNGNYYYRLRQVDLDGTFDYSETVVISVNRKGDIKTDVYPNPAYRFVNINIETSELTDVQAVILDVTGRLVMNNVISGDVPVGRTEIRVPLGNLSAGTYIVRITSGESVFNHKILVLNR